MYDHMIPFSCKSERSLDAAAVFSLDLTIGC